MSAIPGIRLLEAFAQLTVRQTQKVDEKVLLFGFDLPVRFHLKGQEAPVDFKVTVGKAEEDFHFALTSAPELVRLDPEGTVLMKVDFPTPPEMMKRLLEADVLGRLQAVRDLGNRKDADSVLSLNIALNSDAFYGVRIEAAKSLKKINTPESRTVLIYGVQQPDARVRKEVVDSLAAFPRQMRRKRYGSLPVRKKNPEILAGIIKSWGARPGDAKVMPPCGSIWAAKAITTPWPLRSSRRCALRTMERRCR